MQHHRLAPTAAPSVNPAGLVSASQGRLAEFFELIKNEFDTVGQDGNVWKAQRDEYEVKSE